MLRPSDPRLRATNRMQNVTLKASGALASATSTGPPPGADELVARMENVPFSRWHTKARIVMGSATFFDAFNALSLAFALPILIRLWHISSKQVGILIAASYVGQLAGALLFSGLAERFGRVRSATASVAIMSALSLGCVIVGSFPALLACRLVQGVGVGGEVPVAAAYISELSRAHGRGRFFLLYELVFPVGLMTTGQIGAWLVPVWGWKVMFLIGGIPGLAITLLLARLPESPRWLISKGRLSEAERIVRQIESSTGRRYSTAAASGGALVTAAPSPPLTRGATPGQPERSRWSELLSPLYRRRTLIVWTLWASAYFIANSLNNWMPSLYNTFYHLGLRESLRAASMTNVAQVIILLVCAFSIDRIGRRNWTAASFVAGGALLAALGFAGSRSVISVIILGTLSYGIIGSTNAVLYLYTPEIYATRIRALGTGLATSWLRLASAVGPALVGVMVGVRGVSSVFLMFAGAAVVGALAATRMIETRDRRLEEIAP
jgi:MFS transporter, putative metabolite:H+ symporter